MQCSNDDMMFDAIFNILYGPCKLQTTLENNNSIDKKE